MNDLQDQNGVFSGQQNNSEVVDMASIGEMFRGVVEPLAEGQKAAAIERTKQTEIISKERTKKFWGACAIAGAVVVIAAIALYLGKDQLTEKILIAIVSFLGGIGFGKNESKNT
jgi:hypothetical protein